MPAAFLEPRINFKGMENVAPKKGERVQPLCFDPLKNYSLDLKLFKK